MAQLPPNGNLESWGDYGEFYESPEFWLTSNTEADTAVIKVTDAYEGEFAMEVNSMIPDVFQEGMAKVGFALTESFTTVTAWVKAEINGAAQVSIYVENYENDILIGFEQWYSNESIPEWQQITIDITEELNDSVVIMVLATGGDFAYGAATITVDAFWIDAGGNGVDDISKSACDVKISTFPESFELHANQLIQNITLYNIAGQILFEEKNFSKFYRLENSRVPSGMHILLTEMDG